MKALNFLVVAALFVTVVTNLLAQASVAVVPVAFATRPGDTPNLFPLFPGAGSPLRYQQIFKAGDFPPGPIKITQLAFRPDSANSIPFSGSIPQIQIGLTTSPSGVDALNTNFAGNLGADFTVVYPMGPLSVASSATATGTGTRAFDLLVPLVTPFVYDPAAGNLLLEVQSGQGGTTAPFTTAEVDASISSTDTTSRLVNFGNANAVSGSPDSGGAIIEFTYTNITTSTNGGTSPASQTVPDHIVVVIYENHSHGDIIGNSNAPNFTALAAAGANFIAAPADSGAVTSGSHAVRHPSQPNYLELFSGSDQGTIQDGHPGTTDEPFTTAPPFNTPNLGASLRNAGYSFATYSQGLPSAGFDGDSATTVAGQNQYERKHNPVANWVNDSSPVGNDLPSSVNQPFTTFTSIGEGPGSFANLPTVSCVVPDEQNDMHDGSVAQGDAWLKANILDTYLAWAQTHNSLLIVTFDEDGDNTPSNLIPTMFAGPMVRPGNFYEMNINAGNPYVLNPSDPGIETPTGTAMNHYNVLSTIEDFYGLPHIGGSINRPRINDVFALQTPPPTLKIQLTSTNTALVYWPYPSTGFNLQQSTNLTSPYWVTPSETVTNNGTINYILVNPGPGSRFYRLKSP